MELFVKKQNSKMENSQSTESVEVASIFNSNCFTIAKDQHIIANECWNEKNPFSLNPVLVLRVLTDCNLSAEDLSSLETCCKFFKRPANFPPDHFLSLPELAAFEMCEQRPTFRSLSNDLKCKLKKRCGNSWKLVLRYLTASERCCRHNQSQVVAGCSHSVVVNSEGKVFTFGNGASGQLGHGSDTNEYKPRLLKSMEGIRVVQAAAGKSRTMLVGDDGSVYHCGRDCFGDQDYILNPPEPVLSPRKIASLQGTFVVQVTMGSFFTAILSSDGHVYTLSWGVHERLGHATDTHDSEPRLLGGPLLELPVVQIAGGHCYLLSLTYAPPPHNRSVWSLGCGLGGKLGHGSRTDERTPKEIVAFRAIDFQPIAISAGAWHAVALSSDGRIATWGWGRHGCLGHGSDHCETLPRVVGNLAGVRACHVVAGDYVTFVLGNQGEVMAFGSCDSTCLGSRFENGEDVGSDEIDGQPHHRRDLMWPRRITAFDLWSGEDRIVQLSPSNSGHWDSHLLVLTKSGKVLSCGAGSKGQLGVQLINGVISRVYPDIINDLHL